MGPGRYVNWPWVCGECMVGVQTGYGQASDILVYPPSLQVPISDFFLGKRKKKQKGGKG